MESTVRILNLEDNVVDSELIRARLRVEGLECEITRVESYVDFRSSLDQGVIDLIISDYSLPSFDGRSALQHARASHPEVPFIFFSGTIGEEAAIEALREGATDYILKQRPARLVPAVRRALHESKERSASKSTREALTQAEELLRQAQKMEAIGRLAAGVAHDFNNLLTIINGYASLLIQEFDPDDSRRSGLQEIGKAGKRAATLTQQLLAFSRKQVLQPKILVINEVIADSEKMLRRLIGVDIEMVMVLDPTLGRVKADPGQLEQVLMNLVINSRDAMPKGGMLTIETANVTLEETDLFSHVDTRPGNYVMLQVRDNGSGMEPATVRQIFEPFFTTKGEGKGTGLGLATVYGIIRQSGGEISVTSETGAGTAFKIYLPRVDEPAESLVPKECLSESSLRGSETVLILEDDEIVRNLASQILRTLGYKVLEAGDGSEALRVCKRYRGPINLMLADVVVPRTSVTELAEKLADGHPEMKVLYMSGYSDDHGIDTGASEVKSGFIQKPFTAQSLARSVRRTLEEK